MTLRDIDWTTVDVDWSNVWRGLALYDSACHVCTEPITAGQWIKRVGTKTNMITFHAEHDMPNLDLTPKSEAAQLENIATMLDALAAAVRGLVHRGCAADGPPF